MNNYKYRIDYAYTDENNKAIYISIAYFETEEGAKEYEEILKKQNKNFIRTTTNNNEIEQIINESLKSYKKILP